MKVIPTEIDGVMILEPKVFGDARGYFFESWNEAALAEAGIHARFIQDNESKSPVRRAARTSLSGAALYAGEAGAGDLRRGARCGGGHPSGSPTFGRHVAVELSGENKRQLFVPRGFAHGFVVLSDEVIFAYKCDNRYSPPHERGIAFDDPELGIDWRVKVDSFILSPKDTRNPRLAEAELFDFNEEKQG